MVDEAKGGGDKGWGRGKVRRERLGEEKVWRDWVILMFKALVLDLETGRRP